jgi:uncharacterized protein (TIRG00374 family)
MKKYRLNIILLVIVAFVVIFFTLKDDFNGAMNYFKNMNYLWVLVAALCMILNILFQSLSQYRFLKEIDPNYKFSSCFKLMCMAMFFNAITPFSSGGQPFEMYLLNKEGIKVSDSLNALMQNFITYQFGLIFTSTIAIILNGIFKILPDTLLLKKIVLIGYFANILVMGIIIFISRAKKLNTKLFSKIFKFIFHFKFIKNKEQKEEKFNKYLEDFYNSTAIMKNNKKNTILSFIFNLISLCFLYVIPIFVFYSFGYSKINYLESFVSSSFTFLIGSFVPIPGATGGLEYGFIDFFKIFIKSGAMLSAGMLLWRLITYYFGMVLGGIVLMTYRRKRK